MSIPPEVDELQLSDLEKASLVVSLTDEDVYYSILISVNRIDVTPSNANHGTCPTEEINAKEEFLSAITEDDEVAFDAIVNHLNNITGLELTKLDVLKQWGRVLVKIFGAT